MPSSRPDYAKTRETLRWQVALVLVVLMSALMLALGLLGEASRAAVAAGGEGLEPGTVTVSIGLTAWARDESPEAALARADIALYAAKHAGRDRVVDA